MTTPAATTATTPADDFHSLNEVLKLVKDRVRSVVSGLTHGTYIYGRPGTSKTYTVTNLLDTICPDYWYCNGHMTPVGLLDTLEEHPRQVIVIDDINAIFRDNQSQSFLMAALGSQGEDKDEGGRPIRYVQHKKANKPRNIAFSGAIIGISNLDLAGHNPDIMAALRDRIPVVPYDPTDAQMIALCRNIASKGAQGLVSEECHIVLSYMLSCLEGTNIRPSVRLYVDKCLKDFLLWKQGSETHWQDLVRHSVKQQMLELTQPTSDMSQQERMMYDRSIAIEIYKSFDSKQARIDAWMIRMKGKSSPATFGRHITKAKQLGLCKIPKTVQD